ncbi:MAG TPA: DUF2000 domain-containing protein [Thermomicrobiales bacterium]|nr:DUF2000 domain-containing protein [Thermomicrobiales bacterium]
MQAIANNEETAGVVGFTSEEIRPDQSTRQARLKWVIVVDEALDVGRMVNAAACVAAAVGFSVPGMLGEGGSDASSTFHPGLPWAGCTILKASSETIRDLQAKVSGQEGFFIADMPLPAQQSRVYEEYLGELARIPAAELPLLVLSIVGPRNRVDRLVKRLELL